MSGESVSADVRVTEHILETLDKQVLKKITCQSKYLMGMELCYTGSGSLNDFHL